MKRERPYPLIKILSSPLSWNLLGRTRGPRFPFPLTHRIVNVNDAQLRRTIAPYLEIASHDVRGNRGHVSRGQSSRRLTRRFRCASIYQHSLLQPLNQHFEKRSPCKATNSAGHSTAFWEYPTFATTRRLPLSPFSCEFPQVRGKRWNVVYGLERRLTTAQQLLPNVSLVAEASRSGDLLAEESARSFRGRLRLNDRVPFAAVRLRSHELLDRLSL